MAYPVYIKDKEDVMIFLLNPEKAEYRNELEGVSIALEGYKEYKDEYIESTKEEYDKYNQDLEDSWSREARLTNKEWKEVIQILSEDDKGKLIADKIKDFWDIRLSL